MKQLLPFETVIFDLDGTLAQSAPGVFQCVTEALQRMNKPIPDKATLRKFIGPPLCHSFIHFCGMTQEEADIGVAHYRDVYLNGGIYNNSTFPYIMELLQNLKEHGAKLCVATSKPEPMAKIVLDHLKVTPFLDYMAGADLDERHSNKTEHSSYVTAFSFLERLTTKISFAPIYSATAVTVLQVPPLPHIITFLSFNVIPCAFRLYKKPAKSVL